MIIKLTLAFLFILFLASVGYLLEFPKAPKMPKFPFPPISKDSKGNLDKKGVLYKVRITTYKGSSLEGKLSLKGEGVTIKNKKEDFVFYKKLLYKDIKSIELIKWGEAVVDSNLNSKDGKLYTFYPIEFKIASRAGEVFSFYGRVTELEKFKLTNDLGTTVIYSLFYDYWTGKVWKNSRSKKFEHNRSTPNSSCLKKIIFTD